MLKKVYIKQKTKNTMLPEHFQNQIEKFRRRGKMDAPNTHTSLHVFMTAHFPSLVQALH